GQPEILSTFAYVHEALGIITDAEDAFRQKSIAP
ncbi:MAG: type I methionyl aminopeptidase, partial [Winogradskyella sp.]|nr:type I methionyl aminopeptidase [Winogradskyella sp.]